MSLYYGDGHDVEDAPSVRILLTPSLSAQRQFVQLCSCLAPSLGENAMLFVQPFKASLEIMTLQFRADRLLATAPSTSIKIPL